MKEENQKELTKKLFDYVILSVELNETQRKKGIAVRDQDYELASILRKLEVEIIDKLPSIEYLKELRSNLI